MSEIPVDKAPRETPVKAPRASYAAAEPRKETAPRPAQKAASNEPREPRAPREFQEHREPSAPRAPRTVKPDPEEENFTPVVADHEAAQFLSGMITRMGMKASISVTENGKDFTIDLSGPHMGKLIGRRGETLDALQYLCSLYINRDKDDYRRVTLDTENYREKRQQALVALADKVAGRVLKTGRKVVMEPMNPYERRILHATLQDREGVTTYSQGEEPNRRVIVDLKINNK